MKEKVTDTLDYWSQQGMIVHGINHEENFVEYAIPIPFVVDGIYYGYGEVGDIHRSIYSRPIIQLIDQPFVTERDPYTSATMHATNLEFQSEKMRWEYKDLEWDPTIRL